MKLRQIIHVATAFAAMTIMTVTAWGQAMTRMTGSVVGEDGNPIQGAEVLIQRTDIKANYPIKTDKGGKFVYATLPLGTYDITVKVDGQQVYQKTGVRTSYSEPYTLDVDLKQIKQEQAARAAAASGVQTAPGFIPLPNSTLPPLTVQVAPAETSANNGPSEAEMAAAREKYEREMKEYEEAQGKMKGLQEAFAAGNDALKAGNIDAAISAFQKAGEFDPKQDAVWANLGDAYRQSGDKKRGSERISAYEKSAESFGKAIALKPDNASYYFDQSLAYARANKMNEATAVLDQGVKLDATQAGRGYRNLGAVYFDSGNPQAAEAAFKKAIEVDPKNPDAYFQLGQTLMQSVTEDKGKLVAPAGTVESFQKYLELAPTGGYAADAKAMIETLGATVTNSVSQRKK